MFDVCVVIVNYNTKAELEKCLPSVFADARESLLYLKVVVVDNASSDGSVDIIKSNFPEVQIIQQTENVGFGAAQNIGIEAVEAKYYFVLNPDTFFFPGRNTLRSLYDFMEAEPKIGIVGPKIVYPDGSLQFSCYRFPTILQPLYSRTRLGKHGRGRKYQENLVMGDFDHDERRPVDWLMGSALFIRGTVLKEIGKFDERFWMYYEDSDLCRRAWEAGKPVYYVPDIVIEHVHARRSAEVSGIVISILKNKFARIHIASWLKYMWKWRGNYKYYSP